MYAGSIRLLPPDRIAGLIPAECGGIRGRTESAAACVQLYFRASGDCVWRRNRLLRALQPHSLEFAVSALERPPAGFRAVLFHSGDRKSTRLNSSHGYISYAVF